MEDIVARHLPKARIREGGQEGSDHAYLVVYDDKEAYEVDVPPGVYEVGGGYSWRKIKDARVAPDDVVVHPIPRSWIEDEDDEAGYVEIEPLVCLGLGVAGALVAPTINERIIARPLGRHVPPSVGAVALTVVLAVAARRAGRLRLARGVAAAGVGLAVGTAATARRPRSLLGPTQP